MEGNYPEGVTTHDIDRNFGPVCYWCGDPVYHDWYTHDQENNIICFKCLHNELEY